MGVDAEGEPTVAGFARRPTMELREWGEACRLATDDGQRQRETEDPGTDGRLRRATDGDPDGEGVLDRTRIHAAIVDGRAMIEVSGNVTLDRCEALGKLGVDLVSSGALTHSITAADISLLFQS